MSNLWFLTFHSIYFEAGRKRGICIVGQVDWEWPGKVHQNFHSTGQAVACRVEGGGILNWWWEPEVGMRHAVTCSCFTRCSPHFTVKWCEMCPNAGEIHFPLQLWNVVKANGGSFKRHPQDARRHELWPHYSLLWLRSNIAPFDFAFSDVGLVARWQPLAQGAVHSDLSGSLAYSDSAKGHFNSVVLKPKLKDCEWHWTIWTAWAWHVLT